MRFTRFAKGRTVRRTPGTMNKTEAAYAAILAVEQAAGEVLWFAFEAMTFKLAPDTRFTPDFVVMAADGTMEIREVKGHWEDDALVKIKVCAELFPFRVRAFSPVAKRDGGGWKERTFGE